MNILLEIAIIFFGIIILTVLQKYHYKMLYFLMRNTHLIVKKIFQFFIRFGIIIHEICHLIFGILSGSKVSAINLFSKNGGSVSFQTKNYIGSLPQHYDKPGFLLKLFFNQVGIFLTSLGPLIFGIVFTIFIQKKLQIPLEIDKIPIFFMQLSTIEVCLFALYFLLIPSFILSFQDIKHFIISRQTNLGATIVGSCINGTIFFCFLLFLSLFFNFFLLFFILYISVFGILLFIFIIKIVFSYFLKKTFKN